MNWEAMKQGAIELLQLQRRVAEIEVLKRIETGDVATDAKRAVRTAQNINFLPRLMAKLEPNRR